MIIRPLSDKARTTIPQAVLNTLGVRPGDAIGYEIVDGSVRLRRVTADHSPMTAFFEWASEADRIGYADL